MLQSLRATWVWIAVLLGAFRESNRGSCRIKLVEIGVTCQIGDAHVIRVARLVVHPGKSVRRIFAKDLVKRNHRLEQMPPLELIQPAQTVDGCRKGRLLDRRQRPGGERLGHAIQHELQLRKLERLRQQKNFRKQERRVSLCLPHINSERFGRPDTLGRSEIDLGQIGDARKRSLRRDVNMRKHLQCRGGAFSRRNRSLQHATALKQFKLWRQVLAGHAILRGLQRLLQRCCKGLQPLG